MPKILGIETSCDETAASIVDDEKNILSNVISSHIAEHQPYGGVVPEISSRAHLRLIEDVVAKAFKDADMEYADIDAIAVTAGPGLIGGVIVGVMTAKAMAMALNKPIIAVNHLEGHALTVRLTEDAPYPYLLFLASGGHCQFLAVEGLGQYKLIGQTLDDALGECYDKVAKMLGMPYPGGPEVEKMAKNGVVDERLFPIPMARHKGCDLSFSGLKTAVRQYAQALGTPSEQKIADICASFQWAAAESVASKLGRAMTAYEKSSHSSTSNLTHPACGGGKGGANAAQTDSLLATQMPPLPIALRSPSPPQAGGINTKRLVFAGGVAANQYLRGKIEAVCDANGYSLHVPPIGLCTDNAAMIAWAGMEYFLKGQTSELDFEPRASWSLY